MTTDNGKPYAPKLTTKQTLAVKLALSGDRKKLTQALNEQQDLINLVRKCHEDGNKKWANGMLKFHYEVLGYLGYIMDVTHPNFGEKRKHGRKA